MLDLKRLSLLTEFAAHGTIAATADALHFSRSGVSQQLSVLEREAGVVLFEHVGRNLRLTPAGWVLLDHARAILDRVAEATSELESVQRQVHGRVRIGVFQTAAIYVLPRALLALREQHPSLTVEVLHSDPETALPELQRGALDMVIGPSYDLASVSVPLGLTYRHLARGSVVLALPTDHRLASGSGDIQLSELSGDTFAAGAPGTGFGDLTLRLCTDVGGFTPDIRYRSPDAAVLLALVQNGLAVAVVPSMVAADRTAVAFKAIAGGPFGREVFAAVRTSNANRPSLAAVIESVQMAITDVH